MPQDASGSLTLAQWLERIQVLHPVEIDMGLQRVAEVASRLGLGAGMPPAPLVITVGGTNGKGSCVAMLDAILRAAGLRTGTYTSPHIHTYNERVTLDGHPVADELFCAAFSRIEQARGDTSLSYFEYGTLAALLMIREAGCDVAILEVGLGGRLDAVNLIDADVAIISSIDLDHQEWLGDTREKIGYEKAGIMRAGAPAVIGDPDAPHSVRQHAQQVGALLYLQQKDFGFRESADSWSWWGQGGAPLSDLPRPGLDLVNAATVLQALALLPSPPAEAAIRQGLQGLQLRGRFQQMSDAAHPYPVIVDVAHNPHAGRMLASKLRTLRQRMGPGRTRMLLAMMADKDQIGFVQALGNVIDIWYIAHFAQPRCLDATRLYAMLEEQLFRMSPDRLQGPFGSVPQAYEAACSQAEPGDIIVAAGSFFTVAEVMQLINDSSAG
jgi:dihydrofolate synthase / folylpolyglutamate synthase